MTEWLIVERIIETLNWLTITTPFILAYGACEYGSGKNWSSLASYVAGTAAFVALVVVWYFLYQAIHFPLWMGWFA